MEPPRRFTEAQLVRAAAQLKAAISRLMQQEQDTYPNREMFVQAKVLQFLRRARRPVKANALFGMLEYRQITAAEIRKATSVLHDNHKIKLDGDCFELIPEK